MKNVKNSGFTLIEIIVVLIIVGILAAIALPNLFANVQKSKGTTAIAAMDGAKSAIETCAAQYDTAPQNNTGPCSFTKADGSSAYGITIDPNNPNNDFWYSLAQSNLNAPTASSGIQVLPTGKPSAGNLTYSILAYDGINVITLTRSTNGTFTCSAPTAGPYAGVC